MAMPISELLTELEIEKFSKLSDRISSPEYLKLIKTRKLDSKNITISDHALKNMKERFGMGSDTNADVIKRFRSLISKATFINVTVGEDGHRSLMYGVYVKRSLAAEILIELDYSRVITIIDMPVARYLMPIFMTEKVEKIYRYELRKLNAKEKKLMDNEELFQTECLYLLYQAKLAFLKTSSKKKKEEYSIIIKENEDKIQNHTVDLTSIQKEIKTISRTLLALLSSYTKDTEDSKDE